MRATFHTELAELIADLTRMARLAAEMMATSSSALHHGDLALAEPVLASEAQMTAMLAGLQRRCVTLLALQAPVATDLRLVVAALHTVGELERMCALAQHVAKITQLKHPRIPIPDDVAPVLARMGVLASRLAKDAATTIETRDPRSVDRLVQADDEVNVLRRHLLDMLFAPDWPHAVEPAVDAALIGRYYERFADHAVAIARQVYYLTTGQISESPTQIGPR
jgi:phosphate transport system protein